ncbi:hypothetical protein MUO65_01210, partial [bacterium]|nr:hypothetical protein [bacterium]
EKQKKQIETWLGAKEGILEAAKLRRDSEAEDQVKDVEVEISKTRVNLVLKEGEAALAKAEVGRLLGIAPEVDFELSQELLEITPERIEEELKQLKEMAAQVGVVGMDDSSRTFPGQIEALKNRLELLDVKAKKVSNDLFGKVVVRGELTYSALFQFYQSYVGLIFSPGEEYSPLALRHLAEAMKNGSEDRLKRIQDGIHQAKQKIGPAERKYEKAHALLTQAEEYLRKAKDDAIMPAMELLQEARELQQASLRDYAEALRIHTALTEGWSEVDRIEDFCSRVDKFVRKDKKELSKEEKKVQDEIVSAMKMLLEELRNDQKLIDRHKDDRGWRPLINSLKEDCNLRIEELKHLKNTLEASLPPSSQREKKLRAEIEGLKPLPVEAPAVVEVESEKTKLESDISYALKENRGLMALRDRLEAWRWEHRRLLRNMREKFFLFRVFGGFLETISTVGGRFAGFIKLGGEDASKLKVAERLVVRGETELKFAEAALVGGAKNAYVNWVRYEALLGLIGRELKVIANQIALDNDLLKQTGDSELEKKIELLKVEKRQLERLATEWEAIRDGARLSYAQIVGRNPEEIKSKSLEKIAEINQLSPDQDVEFSRLFSEFQKEFQKE